MGALGLCLVLLTAGADPGAGPKPGATEEETGAPKAPTEERYTFNLGAKLESLVGTELQGSFNQTEVTSNFILEPGVLFRERSGTGQVTLSYVPWLLYTPADPGQTLFFNRLLVDVQQRLSRTTGLSLVWRFWLGTQSFSPVVNLGTAPGPGTGTGQPPGTTIPQVPQVATLPLLDTSVRLGFYVLTSASLRLDFDAGFIWSEGTTDVARLSLPLQRGPFVDAIGTWKLANHDAIIGTFRSGLLAYGPVYRPGGSNNENGSTVLLPHFNTGLSILGSELGVKWQHALSTNLSTELGGGLGVVWQSSSYDIPSLTDEDLLWLHRTPVPASTTAYPLLGASIRDQVPLSAGQTLLISGTLALLPIVNQFSGTVIERLDISASAVWVVGRQWQFVASAGAAASQNPREVDVRAELRAVAQSTDHLVFAGGIRLAYLNYAVPGALNGTSWVLFIDITGAAGKLGTAAGASSSSGGQGWLQ